MASKTITGTESKMKKASKPDYLAKVKQLSKVETERLLSRMGGKLDRRLEKGKLSQEEALAKQLELEDEQLQAWRKVMYSLKKKEEAKLEKEARKKEKASKPAKKTKASVKTKPAAKSKTATKAKAPAKRKAAAKKA
jgi:hypothetical protein